MSALLLTNGQVQRPYNWILSLAAANGGSGADPQLNVVVWPTQAAYDTDVANGNMDSGSFAAVAVPGFSGTNFGDSATIFAALEALGDDYGGATVIA